MQVRLQLANALQQCFFGPDAFIMQHGRLVVGSVETGLPHYLPLSLSPFLSISPFLSFSLFLSPGSPQPFPHGESSSHMFFVMHGFADVIVPVEGSVDEGKVIGTVKKGDFFGEESLLTDATRTCSIQALTYCDLYG